MCKGTILYVSDELSPEVKEIIVEAGRNVTLECPGVTAQSLVSTLEWWANKMPIVEFKNSGTTVSNHRDRVTFFPNNFTLLFHPVKSIDSGDYQCLANDRKSEAVLRLIVQGKIVRCLNKTFLQFLSIRFNRVAIIYLKNGKKIHYRWSVLQLQVYYLIETDSNLPRAYGLPTIHFVSSIGSPT